MTPELREKIENKAKELYKKFHGHEPVSFNNVMFTGIKARWILLATHCLEQEIKARIDEALRIHGVSHDMLFADCNNCKRIKELNAELLGVKNETR